jgi:hypothetical protein
MQRFRRVSQASAAAGCKKAGVGPAQAFRNGLVAWWSLDENAANSTFNDGYGSNHLTNRTGASTTNTSTQSSATAKQGRSWLPNRTDNTAAVIPRSNTNLDMTTDAIHTFGGWFKTGVTAGTTAFVMGRVGSAFAKLKLWMFVDTSDSSIIKARYSANGTTAAATVSSGVVVDGSEWSLLIASYNRTAGTLTIRIRKEFTGGLSSQSVALGSAIHSGSNDCNFTIGEGFENDTTFDGSNNRTAVIAADECFYSQGEMTDTAFNSIFNAGAGITLAQLLAANP